LSIFLLSFSVRNVGCGSRSPPTTSRVAVPDIFSGKEVYKTKKQGEALQKYLLPLTSYLLLSKAPKDFLGKSEEVIGKK